MKKNIDEMNWRNAFRETPSDCHEAAMQAARSVQEHPAAQRPSYRLRPILIAALIIISMSSVAIAAGKWLGWFDYLDRYTNRGVPNTAMDALQETSGEVWHVGPLNFVVQEVLADRYMATCTTTVSTGDDQQALLCVEPFDAVGMTQSGRHLAQRLGIHPEKTWLEAAAELNLPLYSVRAILELDPVYIGGPALEDFLINEDGSVSFFNQPMLNAEAVPKEFPVPFFLQVVQFDPSTGEPMQQWTDQEQTVTFRIGDMLEERDYNPQDEQTLKGYTLNAIHAQRYATGTYLHIQFTAPDGADVDQCPNLYEVTVSDGFGRELPDGINLSKGFDLTAWPRITVTKMIGADALPESIQISDGMDTIILQ